MPTAAGGNQGGDGHPLAAVQANQARLLATAEVGRLLATADDLKRLGALREDVLAKQQVGGSMLRGLQLGWRAEGNSRQRDFPPGQLAP